MKTIRLKGPMESRTYHRGRVPVKFERGKAVDIDDDFAEELLGQNPDGLTPEAAEPYGIPVFELVTPEAKAPPRPPEI